ncbi:MAG: hypothetical protein GWN74_13470, partial [Thermoplasmata archaeon]|nr:hypothetical protein [Thermoplasmata archaeon]NIT78467.1 hypothetical protein [Thermoplasmata archaeon]NIU50060.1 hypothetical protein [Thermoplasmata archaeon]NIY04836.1 hypothetical protein [Thermoplasmata archaeon]
MLNRTERCWVALPLLLVIALMAVALQTGGETHTWNDEASFEGGDWEATTWDHDENGITLTGRSSFWKYPGNSVLKEGASTAWDDEGILEPCVVFAKGQYYVYYTGYDGSEYAIGLARSTDGTTMTKYGSSGVVSKGTSGTYDGTGCREPSVLYEDGLFKMWYTGLNGVTESIAYATSKDGLSWTKYGSNPVLSQPSSSAWGDTVLGDPCVIKVDGMYLMYLTGNKVSASNKLVGMATSSDGTSWDLHGSNPVVSEAPTGAFGRYDICDVAVIKDGPVFRMYFSGRDTNTDKYKIGYGESFDGFTWSLSGSKYIGLGASGSFDGTELNSPAVIMED